MNNHILKQDVLSGYSHRDYHDKIHSIIGNIKETIFLTEENGWINSDGNKVDVGTWNRDSRIATLDNKIEQRGKLFVIKVSTSICRLAAIKNPIATVITPNNFILS